jgi:hypothetical protein
MFTTEPCTQREEVQEAHKYIEAQYMLLYRQVACVKVVVVVFLREGRYLPALSPIYKHNVKLLLIVK